jgi:hypothetical protein
MLKEPRLSHAKKWFVHGLAIVDGELFLKTFTLQLQPKCRYIRVFFFFFFFSILWFQKFGNFSQIFKFILKNEKSSKFVFTVWKFTPKKPWYRWAFRNLNQFEQTTTTNLPMKERWRQMSCHHWIIILLNTSSIGVKSSSTWGDPKQIVFLPYICLAFR